MSSKPWLAVSTALALTACATVSDDPNRPVTPACDQTVNCFYERSIRSFQVLDDDSVVVLVGADRCPFRLELDGFFCNLRMSTFLAFDDPDGRICSWDRTVVAGGPFAREDEYCRVRRVTPMTDDELLEAYATSGLAPPPPAKGSGELEVVEEPAQATQESAGAAGAPPEPVETPAADGPAGP